MKTTELTKMFGVMMAQIKSELKDELMNELATQKSNKPKPRTVTGQIALAHYLGCSVPTVARWQASGKLSGCYTQIGRKLIFNLDRIDEKFKK